MRLATTHTTANTTTTTTTTTTVCVCASLSAECASLQLYRDMLLSRLESTAAAQRYLETVAKTAQEFHEIHEIVARHMTLVSTQQVSTSVYAVAEKYT